jgi:glucose-6-phosphate dehydrogenase assembly protein OpcA
MKARGLDALLPGSTEVSFNEVEAALAGLLEKHEGRRTTRASTGTLIVVGDAARLAPAIGALAEIDRASGVRAILISEGDRSTPAVRISESMVVIDGLAPRYLNNAVAALRVPCMPALVWWRGGSLQALADLTGLVDRIVIDAEQPDEVWELIARLFDQTALTDLRWTRLTRWRAMLAHLFDVPGVREAAGGFDRLTIEAHDRPAARLFAAWLVSSLGRRPAQIDIRILEGESASMLDSVRLGGDPLSIGIRMLPNGTCLEATVEGNDAEVRVAPLGETTLSRWIGEELAVRARDRAFERALAAMSELVA